MRQSLFRVEKRSRIVKLAALIILLLFNLVLYSLITSLLRAPSDAKVLGGVVLAVVLVVTDLVSIKYLIRK